MVGARVPATTVRDDVRIQKQVLEYLGVESIAAVVGGSMGGMAVLERPLVFPTRFPGQPTQLRATSRPSCTATSARHSAWCISWAEAQRQSIYSDPLFKHGTTNRPATAQRLERSTHGCPVDVPVEGQLRVALRS